MVLAAFFLASPAAASSTMSRVTKSGCRIIIVRRHAVRSAAVKLAMSSTYKSPSSGMTA